MKIFLTALALVVLASGPVIAQTIPADAPPPKPIAAAPADICASLQKEWDAKPSPAAEGVANEGKKLCSSGKYAEGALKLRQALGK